MVARKYFDSKGGVIDNGFVNDNKLGIRSGKLLKGMYFKANNDGFDIGNSTKYAWVQENGMFVKSKGNMHKYFWGKYYESKGKAEWYKWVALSVIKKGGVNLKPRPFFKPTLDDLKNSTEWKLQIAKEIFSRMIRVWNNA